MAGAQPSRGVRHDGRILERASSEPSVEAAGAPLGAVTSDWIERRPPVPIQPSRQSQKIPYLLRKQRVRRGPKRPENGWQDPKRLAVRLAEIGSLQGHAARVRSVRQDRAIEHCVGARSPHGLRPRTGSHLVQTCSPCSRGSPRMPDCLTRRVPPAGRSGSRRGRQRVLRASSTSCCG